MPDQIMSDKILTASKLLRLNKWLQSNINKAIIQTQGFRAVKNYRLQFTTILGSHGLRSAMHWGKASLRQRGKREMTPGFFFAG